jgi:general secretion pathway protein G
MSTLPNTSKSAKKNGFTLIELLVVVVIIAILAALLMVNFIGVRQRGRDAERKSDLRQIQAALELYRSDNGFYPTNSPFPTGSACGSQFAFNSVIYMRAIPCDPLSTTTTQIPYVYSSPDSGVTYTIFTCLENTSDMDRDTGSGGSPVPQASCTSSGKVSMTLLSP